MCVAILFPPCFLPSSSIHELLLLLVAAGGALSLSTQPQNEVYENFLHQIEVFQIVLLQPEMNNTDLSQNGVFKIATVNYQLSNKIITIVDYLLNQQLLVVKN